MPEIELKSRYVKLVFEVESPGRYFDMKKFKQHLHIDEAEVMLEHRSGGRKLTVTVPFNNVPHPEVITDAWNRHWEQDDREHEEKTNLQKMECDKFREGGFSTPGNEFYGLAPEEESLKELQKTIYKRLIWAEAEYVNGDYSQASCYYSDADDLLAIGAYAKQGDRTRAREAATGLDTCVREEIPDRLWTWLHYKANEPTL